MTMVRKPLLAALLVALAALPAAASAQTVTTTHGVVARGQVTGWGGYKFPGSLVPREVGDVLHPILEPLGFTWEDKWIPRHEVLAPDGHPVWFAAGFVDPTKGDVTGTPPQAFVGVDLRRPWGWFRAMREFESLSWTTKCETSAFNPAGYGDTTAGSGRGALDDVWFDVPCDDGLGYDFYRVHFYEDPVGSPYEDDGSRRAWVDSSTGLVPMTGLSSKAQVGPMAVCGHKPDGSGWDCYSTPGAPGSTSAWVWPDIERLTVSTTY
jgi:hypothetical protein